MTDTRCEYCAMTMHLVFALGRRVQELEADLYCLVEHEPAPEPDYEALGYPETAFGYEEVDSLAAVPIVFHRWFHSLCRATDKE